MEVQDYDIEYYEAHSKDVDLTAITSSQNNADVLARLRDNDPESSKCMYITVYPEDEYDFHVREGDDLGWLGYFVGKSKQIETLHIDTFPDDIDINDINLNAFLKGLGHNRSIESLQIWTDLAESFLSLAPFLRNNDSLRELKLNWFYIGLQRARNIAFLLGQSNSLKRLRFDDNGLEDEGLVEIVTALRAHAQIEELSMPSNYNLGRECYIALGRVLEGWRNPSLSLLDIGYSDIEDEGLCALVVGLRNCHNLTSLNLNRNRSITKVGLRSLSTLFQSDNCRLECLDLGYINIGDDGMDVLAPGLASVPSLRNLNLCYNSIGDQGIQALVGALDSCNIEELRLSGNRLIIVNGLRSLSSLFRAEKCTLFILELYGTHVGDEGVAAMANALVGNKSLTTLGINTSGITTNGWEAFSKLLCDTSSVNNTYLSNHTLVQIGSEYGMQNTPSDIEEYLKLNESLKQAAAVCKILHSHPDIDITPLFQFNLKCLPLVVGWLEKAKPYSNNVNESTEHFQCRQLSTVYKFVRGMPQLAVDVYRKEKKTKDIHSDAKKRKFDRLT